MDKTKILLSLMLTCMPLIALSQERQLHNYGIEPLMPLFYGIVGAFILGPMIILALSKKQHSKRYLISIILLTVIDLMLFSANSIKLAMAIAVIPFLATMIFFLKDMER